MIISIWAGSLEEAHSLIEKLHLANSFMQFVEDQQMKHAYWIVLRLTNRMTLKEIKNNNPRLTIMGI